MSHREFTPLNAYIKFTSARKFQTRHHADTRILDAWRDEVERETWQTSQDIKQRFKSADFLVDNRVIFNIKGNSYRLVVGVRYRGGIVVTEWLAHAAYSKERNFKSPIKILESMPGEKE
ncbi:MAG: type II toxin-antitoxin system HigB family toxin [Nitrosomonadales bacterium]|nr:type II toxin-antitoxin system HigB family toxin [Nitrosomonadales bacterium]